MRRILILLLSLIAFASIAQTNRFSSVYLTTTPANDDALTQVLVRDPITGLVKYRSSSTLGGWAITGTTNVTNPIISGSGTFSGGRWTFTPGASIESLNFGSIAGSPSGPNDGGAWYSTTPGTFMGRAQGLNEYFNLMVTADAVATRIPIVAASNGRLTTLSGFAMAGSLLTIPGFVSVSSLFNPSSGSTGYTGIVVAPVFNTTGTYSGNLKGVYVNSTNNSLTGATWNAIETTSGSTFLANNSSDVITANTRLDVRGISTGNILRLASDANSQQVLLTNAGSLTTSLTNLNINSTAVTIGSAGGGNTFALTSNGGGFSMSAGTTTNSGYGISLTKTFNPTSGTNTTNVLEILPTWNTTGTYSGNLRGLYINSTNTSLTGATWNAIETTSGNIVFAGIGQDDTKTRIAAFDSNGKLFWRAASTFGSVTNTAANNELMKSDGTNAVPSGIFSTSTGDVDLGGASTGGSARNISAIGSGSNINLFLKTKGTGSFVAQDETSNQYFAASPSTFAGAWSTNTGTLDLTTAATNSVGYVAKFRHASTGTPTNGIGAGLQLETETSVSNYEIGATIESVVTDATSTSEDIDLAFKTMTAGAAATEKIRVSSLGVFGIGTATPGTFNGTDLTTFTKLHTYSSSNVNVNLLDGANGASLYFNDRSQSAGNKAWAIRTGLDLSIGTSDDAGNTSTRMQFLRNGNVGIGNITSSPDRLLEIGDENATTNAVTQLLKLSHSTSGTPANGIGSGIEFEAETSVGNNEVGATIEAVVTDATSTSEDFKTVFKNMAAGAAATVTMEISSTGNVTNIIGGTTYQLTPELKGSAALDFPSTAATAVNDLTITVTGAQVGDGCVVGAPNASVTATATYSCWVSATNTVTIRLSTDATENPTSGTFTVFVKKQ